MKHLALVFGLFLILLSSAAHAQNLPASCFDYYRTDSFEGTSAANWSPWNVSSTGDIYVGTTASARTGSKAALFSFAHSEPIGSSFLLIDKVFDVSNYTGSVRTPRYGCAHEIPEPVGQPKYCTASVWIKPADLGATGALQLIDAATYTYVASQPFSFSGSAAWIQVTTPASLTCTRAMVVRIMLTRTKASSTAMVADNVQVDWNY